MFCLPDPVDGEQVNNHAGLHHLPQLRLLVQRDQAAGSWDPREGRIQEGGNLGGELWRWAEGSL